MTTKDQAIAPIITNEMIEAAESVEDLYRRGTPDTWRKVYIAMWAEAPHDKPSPDCRTCVNFRYCEELESARSICTNGDQYKPAPAVVLWRTE